MKALEYTAELEGEKTLKEYLPTLGLSVTLIRKIKRSGIFVDGIPCTVRAKITNGSKIKLILPEEKSDGIPPMDIPLNIVYEDEYILVVDKPKNMPTHPSKGNNLPTLANAVMAYYGSDFVFRSITRLDRDTSGLVLIAKDAICANLLSREIKQGRVYKRYVALLSGIPKDPHGIISAPIRREHEESIKRIVATDGKEATTEYFVKEIIGENALCDVILHTGRTHQIRVHMAYIGHALLGDFLYGERSDDGYYLRCSEIGFIHPMTNEYLSIKVPS